MDSQQPWRKWQMGIRNNLSVECKALIRKPKTTPKEKKNTPERQEPSRKRQTVSQTVVGNTECATFLDCNLTVCIQCSQLYKML